MNNTKKCLDCGRSLDGNLVICPYCGSRKLDNILTYTNPYSNKVNNMQNNQNYNNMSNVQRYNGINSNIQNAQGYGSINGNIQNVQGYGSMNSNIQNAQGYGSMNSNIQNRQMFNDINNTSNLQGYNSINSNIQNRQRFNDVNNISNEQGYNRVNSNMENVQGYSGINNMQNNLNSNSFEYDSFDGERTENILNSNDVNNINQNINNSNASKENIIQKTEGGYGKSYFKNKIMNRFDNSLKDSKKVITTIIVTAAIFVALMGAILVGVSSKDNSTDKSNTVATENKDNNEIKVGSQTDDLENSVEFTKGEISGNYYNNQWLGIKMAIPEGYVESSEEKYSTLEQDSGVCGLSIEKSDGSSVVVLYGKDESNSVTVEQFSEGIQSRIESKSSSYQKSYEEDVSGAGIQFKAIHYNVTKSGISIPLSYYIAKKDNMFITFIVVTPSGSFTSNNSFITGLEN